MRPTKFLTMQHCGILVLTTGALLLSGCATNGVLSGPGAPTVSAGVPLSGAVHGGQQPISGTSIQLYAASTGGYGSASFALLTTAVSTDAAGAFHITGAYTCPSATSQVYITATGGNTGSGNNANLAMMAALGSCGNLSSSTFINMNEVTTVASVYALAPFMSSYTNVGTSATNVAGLANAFAAVNKLSNISTGFAPGAALPVGATVPVSELNTMANILASCINTTGSDGACKTLFTASTPNAGTAPTETIGAVLNMAKNPSRNVSTLFNLVAAKAPFQPTLTAAPTDWTVSITYSNASFNAPSAAVVDAGGNLWVTNAGGNSVSVLTSAGAPLAGSPFTGGGISGPSAVAIDANGNAWIADKISSKVSALNSAGVALAGSPFSGGGLNAPTGIGIDGTGNIWVTNGGNSSVSELSGSGAALSGAGGFTGAGISAPVGLAINPR